jgi:predicted nucleotidyltransferase
VIVPTRRFPTTRCGNALENSHPEKELEREKGENMFDSRLQKITEELPYPHILMALSGAHLYGFPSPDSDYDLRGVYILPVRETVGLYEGRDTITQTSMYEELEIDLVTYDLKKFLALLLNKNGMVLEQIYAPLIVHTTPEHEELKRLAWPCISRNHYHHYYGFAESQWKLFSKEQLPRVKPLLYIYRVLLTGIHLMRTGEVESNLVNLNTIFKLAFIPDLIARKLAGSERARLEDADLAFHQSEYQRLLQELKQSALESTLPEGPSIEVKNQLNEFLVNIRLRATV